MVRLEAGRTREELTDHLLEEAETDPQFIVGFDFAFSFPFWFLQERGLSTARELWARVDERGEDWLASVEDPFWGRPGSTKPDLPDHFRGTEQAVRQETGAQPKSPFQIGGAGAVGTGSIRGMPHLLKLAEAGFSIWPFDPPDFPLVVEIYPRLLTGEVVKSDPEARRAYLDRRFPDLEPGLREEAASNDDAFDAAVSALVMDQNRDELTSLPDVEGEIRRREGVIWRPGLSAEEDFGEKSVGARPEKSGGTQSNQRPEHRVPDTALERALVYAARLHSEQTRKGEDETPYIAHLLGVCSLVLEAGGDEDQAVAALLHDAVEDQGGEETLEAIRRRFGDQVAEIVDACTDAYHHPKPPWHARKEDFLGSLSGLTPDALLVVAADKLYNARSILRDHRFHGDGVFDRFTGDCEGTLWYYRSLADRLRASDLDSWLVDELERAVDELEVRVAGRDEPGDVDRLREAIVDFRDERDWAQFHSLKNLAAALSVEAGELQELFLWEQERDGEPRRGDTRVAEEIADVLIYALLFCHEAELDVEAVVRQKLARNRDRYPVDQARGKSAKYTELDGD